MTVKLVVLSNAVSFFGKDLGIATAAVPAVSRVNEVQQRMSNS